MTERRCVSMEVCRCYYQLHTFFIAPTLFLSYSLTRHSYAKHPAGCLAIVRFDPYYNSCFACSKC